MKSSFVQFQRIYLHCKMVPGNYNLGLFKAGENRTQSVIYSDRLWPRVQNFMYLCLNLKHKFSPWYKRIKYKLNTKKCKCYTKFRNRIYLINIYKIGYDSQKNELTWQILTIAVNKKCNLSSKFKPKSLSLKGLNLQIVIINQLQYLKPLLKCTQRLMKRRYSWSNK